MAVSVNQLRMAEGDRLLLQPAAERAREPALVSAVRQPDKQKLLQAMRCLRGPWPRDFRFDRDGVNSR